MTRKEKPVALELAAKPALRGRPYTAPSARRYVAVQRERVALRLWRHAPTALGYLVDVVAGRQEYSEGKYKAAVQILNRTCPTITAQQVEATTASVTLDGNEFARDLRERLQRAGMLPTDGGT